MTKVVVRVGGPNSTAAARQLVDEWSTFESAHQHGADTVKGADDVVAAVAVTITSLDMLRVLWGWWRHRSGTGCTARIELTDGTQIELSDVSLEQLEQLLGRDLNGDEAAGPDEDENE